MTAAATASAHVEPSVAPERAYSRANLQGFEVRSPERPAACPVELGAAVTVLTRIDGRPAGKTFTPADGAVRKTVEAHTGCYNAETFSFTGSPAEILADYRALVESLTPAQSIILGDAPPASGQPYRVLPAKQIDAKILRPVGLRVIAGTPTLARLKENFRPSRLLLLDFDPHERMPASWRSLDEQGRWELFVAAVPEFSGAARLTIPSGSARVRLPDGSPAKHGPTGSHTYVVMDRALASADLDAMRTALVVRLWARDLGFMGESAAGAALKRTLFDSAVWLAGREVFDGPPDALQPLKLAPIEAQMVVGGFAAPLGPIADSDERVFSERTGARVVRETGTRGNGTDTDARRAPRLLIEDHTMLRMDTVIDTEKGALTVQAFLESGAAKLRCQATFRESSSWNGILRRVGNTAILHDNGTCTTYRIGAADAEQDEPADETTDAGNAGKLTQAEAEQLIAWSWSTGNALPESREQFESDQFNPQNGKPFERLRVRIGVGENSGPWCSLGWRSQTPAEFVERVDAYIDTRFSKKDTGDKETAGPGDFKAHARQWAARVAALSVSGEAAQELLARITPPWPEPEPLRAPVPTPEPYPVEALGDVLGPAVWALHETVKAPLAMCAQSVLASASFAAQAHFDAAMPWGEVKPTSLAMLTVGESGERKSGVDDLVLGAPKAQERAEMTAYADDLLDYESELAQWKRASEAANKRASAKGKGRKEDYREASEEVGPSPRAPILPLRFVTDPTVEGLYKLLAISQPSVALFSDEGGLLIGGHALNSDNALKTLARWCKMWDGAPYDRVRGGDGSGVLYGRRMALHQLAQPDVMSTLLSDRMANGQGFLARCLVAWPESTIGTRVIDRYERGVDRPDIKRLFARLKGLFEAPPRTKENRTQELDPRPLALAADAEPLAVEASNRFEALMRKGMPLCEVRDRASKAMDNAMRIAATLTAIDKGLAAHEISRETFERALILVQWYLAETLRIRGAVAVGQSVVDAESLLDWLKSRGLRMFRSRQVLNAGPAQLRNKVRFAAAVAELASNGYVVENKPGTVVEGVKTRLSWMVNPDVL